MTLLTRHPVAHSSVRHESGFTLVELVVSMAITTIIIGFVAVFMTAPVDAYVDQAGRAALNDSAQVISRSIAADLRSALPNSVRFSNVGNTSIVEMLSVAAVSFYRPTGTIGAAPPLLESDRELEFDPLLPPDTRFSAFGGVAAAGPYSYLVIGNSGTIGRNAYQLSDVITPDGTSITVNSAAAGEESISIDLTSATNPNFRFSAPLPGFSRRLFAVSGPITYICNSDAGQRTLRRYSRYPITSAIPASAASPQLGGATVVNTVLATNVASCRFTCLGAGTSADVCLNTFVVEIIVDRLAPPDTESLRIFEQFSVDNTP